MEGAALGPLADYIENPVQLGEACLPPCASLGVEDLIPLHDSIFLSRESSQQLHSPSSATLVSAARPADSASEWNRAEAGASSRPGGGRIDSFVGQAQVECIQRQNGAAIQLASDPLAVEADACFELGEPSRLSGSLNVSDAGALEEEEDDPTLLMVGAARSGAAPLPGRSRRRDEPARAVSVAQDLPPRRDAFDAFLDDSPKKKPRHRAGRVSEPTVISLLSDDSKSCEPSHGTGASPAWLGCPASPKWLGAGKGGGPGKEGKNGSVSKLPASPPSPAVEVLGASSGIGVGRNKGYNLRQADRNKGEEEEDLKKIYWEVAAGIASKLEAQMLEYPKNREDSVVLAANDLQALEPGGFLNDVIIQFYLKYLQEKLKEEGAKEVRCYFFNTFFYTKLTKSKDDASRNNVARAAAAPSGDAGAPGVRTRASTPPETGDTDAGPAAQDAPTKAQLRAEAAFQRVRRWTKHVNIFDFDFVFIPVNMDEHWSLVVACHFNRFKDGVQDGEARTGEEGPKPYLLHLDSLRQHRYVANPIRSYFAEAYLAQNAGADRAQVESAAKRIRCHSPEVPKQDNFSDCGVFVLKYTEMFLKDHAVPWGSASRSPSQDQPWWFDPLDVGPMRFLILFLVAWILDGDEAGPEPTEEWVKAFLEKRQEEEREHRAQLAQQKRRIAAGAPGPSTTQAGKSTAQAIPKRAPRAPKAGANTGKSLIEHALEAPPVSHCPDAEDSPPDLYEDEGLPFPRSSSSTGEGRSEAGPGREGAHGTTTTLRDSGLPQWLAGEGCSLQQGAAAGANAPNATLRASAPRWGRAAWGGASGDAGKQKFDQDALESAYSESLRPYNPFSDKGRAQGGPEDPQTDHSGSATGTGGQTDAEGPGVFLGEDVEVNEQPQGKLGILDELLELRRSKMKCGGTPGGLGTRAGEAGTSPTAKKVPTRAPAPWQAPSEAPKAKAGTARPSRFQVPKLREHPGTKGTGYGAPSVGQDRATVSSPEAPKEGKGRDLRCPEAGAAEPLESPERAGKVAGEVDARPSDGAAGAQGAGDSVPVLANEESLRRMPLEQEHNDPSVSPQVPRSDRRQARSEALEGAQPECQPIPDASCMHTSEVRTSPGHSDNVRRGDNGAATGGQTAPATHGAGLAEGQAEGRTESVREERTGDQPNLSKARKPKGWREAAQERKAAKARAGGLGAPSMLVGPVMSALLGHGSAWHPGGEAQKGPAKQPLRDTGHAETPSGSPREDPEASHGVGGAAGEGVGSARRDEASEDCRVQEIPQARGAEGAAQGKGPAKAGGWTASAEGRGGAGYPGQREGGSDSEGEVMEVGASTKRKAQGQGSLHGKSELREDGEELAGSGASLSLKGGFSMLAGKKRHLGELNGSPGGSALKGSPKRSSNAAAAEADGFEEDVMEVRQGKGSADEVREVEGPSPLAQKHSKEGSKGLPPRDVGEPKRRTSGPHSEKPDQDDTALDRSLSTSSGGKNGYCKLPLGQGNARLAGSARSPGAGEKSPGPRKGASNARLFGTRMSVGTGPVVPRRWHKKQRQEPEDPHKQRGSGAEGMARKSAPGASSPAERSGSPGEGAAFENEMFVLNGSGRNERGAPTSAHRDAVQDWGDRDTGFLQEDAGGRRSGSLFQAMPSPRRHPERLQQGGSLAGGWGVPAVGSTRDASPSSQRQSSRIQESGQKRREREKQVYETIRGRRGRKKDGQSQVAGLRHPQASALASEQRTVDLTFSDGEG